MAVRTSCHKLSGLKQHNFFIFPFCRSPKWVGKLVCLFVCFLEALEENPIPFLFQLLETACISWPEALHRSGPSVHPHIAVSESDPRASLSQGSLWLYWTHPNNPHFLNLNLTTFVESLLPCITCSQVPEIGTAEVWGNHHFAPRRRAKVQSLFK